MTAGYSATPLERKLGAQPGSRVLVDGSPDGFVLHGVQMDRRAGRAPYDVVLLFALDRARLAKRWPLLVDRLTVAGRLWVCWPKRASAVATNLSDAVVRAHGLERGLVDVKVCAIDETWSGLAFVQRLADR